MPLLSLGAKRLLDDGGGEEEALHDASSQYGGAADYTTEIRLDARSVGSSSARSMLGYTSTSSAGSSDFSWRDDSFVRTYLNYVGSSLKRHVQVKDRRYHATVYKNCFLASEAVDFLVSLPNGVAPSRAHAVLLCQQLALTLQLFEHVCEKEGGGEQEVGLKKEFLDDYLFFHFVGMHSMGNIAFADVLRDYPDIGVMEAVDGVLNLPLPQDWNSLQWDPMALAKLAICLKQRVVVKDRRYRVSVYSKCFLGSEAVDIMLQANPGTIQSRQHALLVLQKLNDSYKVFDHVCGDHEIKDDSLFYHFVDSIPKSSEFDPTEYSFFVQTESPWNGMTVADLEGMVAELKAHSHDTTVDNNALSYNHNRMIRQDGTVMNEDQIRDLRKRHGYCVTCPEDPIRLYMVRRSKFNPLYQKKESLSVPGQSKGGTCLVCNPPAGSVSSSLNVGGFKGGKPRHSLVSIAKIVKNTNTMTNNNMMGDGSMHSTHSHQSSRMNQNNNNNLNTLSKRMPSSASIQSQESSRSTVTTVESADSLSPVPMSFSSHRTTTSNTSVPQHLQTRHLSLLSEPKTTTTTVPQQLQTRHLSLLSEPKTTTSTVPRQSQTRRLSLVLPPEPNRSLSSTVNNNNGRTDLRRSNSDDALTNGRADLRRSNSDDMLAYRTTNNNNNNNNKSNRSVHDGYNSDDGMLSMFVSPDSQEVKSPLPTDDDDELSPNYLHDQYNLSSNKDDSNAIPESPASAMGCSVSSLECESTFQALHQRRHMLAQAQKQGDDLERLMGAIHHKQDETIKPRQGVSRSISLGGHRSSSSSSSMGADSDDDFMIFEDTPGGVIASKEGYNGLLAGNLVKLAQSTDDRLSALETQVSLIILQQEQQTLLMQQNTEMMQRLLAAVLPNAPQSLTTASSETLSRPNIDAISELATSGAVPKTPIPNGSLVVSNTPVASEVSRDPVNKLSLVRSPQFNYSMPLKGESVRESVPAFLPTTEQQDTAQHQPTQNLPRRQSNEHERPDLKKEPQKQEEQKPLDETVSGQKLQEPKVESKLIRLKPPKRSVSMPARHQDNKQQHKQPDLFALRDQQPTGQESFDDVAVHNSPTITAQSDGMLGLVRRDVSFSHTMALADASFNSLSRSEEDGRDRKKTSKKKKKKKDKRNRVTKSSRSLSPFASPDAHASPTSSLQQTLMAQQTTTISQSQTGQW